jgi:hypothetical protein
MPLGKCWLLFVRTYETQNYTVRETAEILQVTASRMYFIAGFRNVKYFLVFCSLVLQNQLSAAGKNFVIKKTTSLTVTFSIYYENLNGTQKYSPYQNGGFF